MPVVRGVLPNKPPVSEGIDALPKSLLANLPFQFSYQATWSRLSPARFLPASTAQGSELDAVRVPHYG